MANLDWTSFKDWRAKVSENNKTGGPNTGHLPRATRVGLRAPIKLEYPSFQTFVDTQSANISRTGMFILTPENVPVGAKVSFELSLDDGFVLISGEAEVARASAEPKGLGVRFLEISPDSRALIDRVVEINAAEERRPVVDVALVHPIGAGSPDDFDVPSPTMENAVVFDGSTMRIQINPATAGFFTNNLLLNIGSGGFVLPTDVQTSMGAQLTVALQKPGGEVLFSGKGKVVAKHAERVGVRLAGLDPAKKALLKSVIDEMSG